MESYLMTIDQVSAGTKFRLTSPVSPAGPARITGPATARTAQMIGQVNWPSVGGCDVTDTKFATRLGPPSCSPPV